MPLPLPPSRWSFCPERWPVDDAVAVGAELEPATVLAAYRAGAFPMPLDDVAPMVWWSPMRRGVLPLDRLRVSRSLWRSVKRYDVRVNTAFEQVLDNCADPRRDGAWISDDIRTAYLRLHGLGWAHSVEAFDATGELVGGLYGLAVGGLFAGESMFHHATDASKVALVALVAALCDEHAEQRLIDVQWQTPHLASLGVEQVPRATYLARLPGLLEVPLPAAFDRAR
ncbi:MAG: leucyl/phenylalanyl-tRNA--protein transferase [Nocardioidaceae bacterium]|nr:leucyl/phenylalanyl-tRNA--protein transferase [Nocardioidaceae bacterium]MDQ3324886.1 leucyl/phenylalanyl-tRNA--protein transferase [Actinomycetota bacterium]